MACRAFIRPGSLIFASIRPSSASQSEGLTGIARSRYFFQLARLPNIMTPISRIEPDRYRLFVSIPPTGTDCARVNGASSITPATTSGA